MYNNYGITCRYGEFQPNPSLPILTKFTRHAQVRMCERGVTEGMVRRWLPEIILRQSDRKLLLYASDGSIVIDIEGNVVTVIPKKYYEPKFIREIDIVKHQLVRGKNETQL